MGTLDYETDLGNTVQISHSYTPLKQIVNPCLAAGCQGACCFNNQINMSGPEFEVYWNKRPDLRAGRNVRFVNSREELDALGEYNSPFPFTAIFKREERDSEGNIHQTYVVMNNKHCHNYQPGKGCAIYGDPNYPKECAGLKKEGSTCRLFRRDNRAEIMINYPIEISEGESLPVAVQSEM